jgi:hypothetical protein
LYSIFLGRVILNIREAITVENFTSTTSQTEGDRFTFLLGDSFNEFPVVLDPESSANDAIAYELDSFNDRANSRLSQHDNFRIQER